MLRTASPKSSNNLFTLYCSCLKVSFSSNIYCSSGAFGCAFKKQETVARLKVFESGAVKVLFSLFQSAFQISEPKYISSEKPYSRCRQSLKPATFGREGNQRSPLKKKALRVRLNIAMIRPVSA